MKGIVLRIEKKFIIVENHGDIEILKNKFETYPGQMVEYTKKQKYRGLAHIDYKGV